MLMHSVEGEPSHLPLPIQRPSENISQMNFTNKGILVTD
jgi:hypothetical protein